MCKRRLESKFNLGELKMIVTDLRNSFNPVPKKERIKDRKSVV